MGAPTAQWTVAALAAAAVALGGLAGCGGDAGKADSDDGGTTEVSVSVSDAKKDDSEGKDWESSPSDGDGLRIETAPDGSVAVVANGDGHVDTTLPIDTQDLLIVSPHKMEAGTMHISIVPADGGAPVYEGDFGPESAVEPAGVPVTGDYYKLDVTASGCKGTVEVMLAYSQEQGADAAAGEGQPAA